MKPLRTDLYMGDRRRDDIEDEHEHEEDYD